MNFKMPFGSRSIRFSIPDSCHVQDFNPRPFPPVSGLKKALFDVMGAPVHSPALKDLVKTHHKIALICDDHTRPTPLRLILPLLLDRLLKMGVSREQIGIFVAYGLHPPMKEAEVLKRFGREIVSNFHIHHHDAHDREMLQSLGKTPFDTPLWVNRRVMDADFRIGIGNISLSKEAGYGGGAKVLMPGVCGAETIHGSHEKVRRHPNQIGRLQGNPIREEIEACGRMAGLDFILNTVLNAHDEICAVAGGHPLYAFREGVRMFNRMYQFDLKTPLDMVVAGSSPYDFEFYQANKAISAASLGVKDGGTIILVSPCDKGISQFSYFDEMVASGKDFVHWQAALGKPQFKHKVAAEICLSLRYLLDVRHITIGMVSSGISANRIAEMGLKPYANLEEGVLDGIKSHGKNALFGIVPRAPMTLLKVLWKAETEGQWTGRNARSC